MMGARMTNPQRSAAGESGAGNITNKQLNNNIKIRVCSMFEDLVNQHRPSIDGAVYDDIRKHWFVDGEFYGDACDLDSDDEIVRLRSVGLKIEIVKTADASSLCLAASEFKYSIGIDKYDNTPEQLVAKDFDAFVTDVLARRSNMKGKTYFCSAFRFGSHSDLSKYPNAGNYRSTTSTEPRRFLPIDFDGFRNPAAFADAFKYLERHKGFGYTTWSHTEMAPRARAVLELDREVSRDEGVLVGEAFEAQMINALGVNFATFDPCVYRGEQPVYGAPQNATIFKFDGKVIEADQLLAFLVPQEPKPNKQSTIDVTTASLASSYKNDPETPENIARVKSALSAIDPNCDRPLWRDICFALHALGWSCSEQLARSWSKGELQ